MNLHILLTVIGLVALALAAFQWLNPNFIPGVFDAALHGEDAVTKSGNYNGAVLDLGIGYAASGVGNPMAAVVTITALDITSGDETYSFTLQESADNATFTACGAPLVLTAAAASAVQSYSAYGFVNRRYIRLALVVGGTTPSVTYVTDFVVVGGGVL